MSRWLPFSFEIILVPSIFQQAAVANEYTVLHPISLQALGSLHGKFTVVVANAAAQPHGFVRTEVVVQPGTKHVLQAVPVEVTTGQLTLLQAFVDTEVVVKIEVAVVVCLTVVVATDVK